MFAHHFFTALACCTLSCTAFAYPLSANSNCNAEHADNFEQMLSCGKIEGSLRLNSYSLNNAYFANQSQDTTTAGGYATYQTARYQGFKVAVGIEGQRRLAEGSHAVSELSQHTFGLGEAYINWTHGLFNITVGNQRLDLPFTGDYSFYRVQPWLYQAIDAKYGTTDDFIRLTKVNKYKSYGDDQFTHSNRLNDDPYSGYQQNFDGMYSLGLGKKLDRTQYSLKGQAWVEHYQDLLDIYYGEASLTFKQAAWQPEIGVQAIYGDETGQKRLGQINSTSFGTQIKLKPTEKIIWKVGYDHIIKDKNSTWYEGALPTPYAHNTSSDPYFAQPFFTSTQDLGAGNFYSTEISSPINKALFMGSRITYADLNTTDGKDMYEVMFYGFYNLSKNFSVSEFVGFQKQHGDANAFLQNRLGLTYNF